MADNTTELEVLNQIVDVLGGQSGQYETVVPTLQQILALLGGGGGGGGGYNPALSVGRADALTGADSTAQWAQRVSTGSSAATVRSVQGASVAWNQMAPTGATFNRDANIAFANGTAIVVGHKLLMRATFDLVAPDGAGNTSVLVFTKDAVSQDYQAFVRSVGSVSGTFYSSIMTVAKGGVSNGTASQVEGNAWMYGAFASGVTGTISNIQLFDLTAMFGSGNEPQTVADFEAMYPEAYYSYSAPTLKPVQIAGIRSTTAQGGELDAIEWTAQTLRAAGSVRDELTADELVTRVGVVDLGTLTWSKYTADTSGASFVTGSPADFKSNTQFQIADFSCAKYTPVAFGGAVFTWTANDKAICQVVQPNRTIIRDTNYENATAAEFKTAMSGVLLFYALATPTTTPISPALPMSYKVQQGGTESIIVPDGEISAAPIITVAEGESVSDVVMDALACIATPDGPTATANHSVGTYLTMQGKLYKVTSAIAVGESIAAGTNVTQTTVMAELIARTA